MPNPFKILPIIFIIFLLGIIFYGVGPISLSNEEKRFVVTLAETDQPAIINRLKNEGLLRSPYAFYVVKNFIAPGKSIEPGAFKLRGDMTLFSLIDTLYYHPYQKWITFPPGLRLEQVAIKLTEKLNWSEEKKKEFLDNASEGYMFPDTYLFNLDFSPKDIAQRMIAQFNEKFDARLQKDLLAEDVRNDTAIKIASLIERESGSLEDKALIAGIIWKRLEIGMPLQIDATIQYALGKEEKWWPIVRGSDVKIDSPYNTYKIKGLPPGPIANPSLASIKAAVYPEKTDCLFYLHDHNKQIHCAVTFEEHKENIKKYL